VYVGANVGQIDYIRSTLPKDIEVSYEIARVFPWDAEDYKVVDSVKYGDEVIVSNIIATGTNYLNVSNYKLAMGRFLNEKDIQDATKVCVIHEALYNLLGRKENLKLEIYGEKFDVVGVVKGSASDASVIVMGKYAEDTSVFITARAASKYIMGVSENKQGMIDRAIMRAPSKYTKEDIQNYMSGARLMSDGEDLIKLKLMEGGEQEKTRLINALSIVKKVLLISALILFLSGLNIIQIATASIYDIKKQIGLNGCRCHKTGHNERNVKGYNPLYTKRRVYRNNDICRCILSNQQNDK
jgi:ABC-type antimicrobial peptide transport system permease subunit